VRRTVLMSLYSESLSFLAAGAGFMILRMSGWKIISGTFTLGSYLAFTAYFAQLLGPTQLVANLGLTLQPAKVALQRIRELMKVVAEDESGPVADITSFEGRIELRNVNFEYEGGKPVFSSINLDIRPGEKVLIGGPNGSGKSTLIKLLMGFTTLRAAKYFWTDDQFRKSPRPRSARGSRSFLKTRSFSRTL